MGVTVEGIPRGCQGLFTPVSMGYPLSVFNKNSTLIETGFRNWLAAFLGFSYDFSMMSMIFL